MLIQGNCPMGCREGLILSELGQLFCADLLCARPTAAAEILADAESEHVVTFEAHCFTIRHPLRERLDDALMRCELHASLAGRGSPLFPAGTYRATSYTGGWTWKLLKLPAQDPAST